MYISEIEKYRSEGSTDEWYIPTLIDRCVSGLSAPQAFDEISAVIDVLLREEEWDIFLNHCQYILRLVRIANTVELPEKLADNISVLRAKVAVLNLEKHNEVQELYAWFRI